MSAARAIVLVVLLATAALVAGCVQAPTTGGAPLSTASVVDASWAAKAIPNSTPADGSKHDHRNWSEHVGLSTPNFEELAHDPLGVAYYGNASAGEYFCGGTATTAQGHHLAVINSFDTDVAFVLVDVTDPDHPVHLGDYMLGQPTPAGPDLGANTYDVDITPDGLHVVIAADTPVLQQNHAPVADAVVPIGGVAPAPVVHVQPRFRDACTGEVRNAGPEQALPIWPGTVLVSIADPKNPVFEDFAPAPVIGPHSVSTAKVGDTIYVAASTTNLVHQASYFQFFEIQELPTGGKLVPVSTFDAGQAGNLMATTNGHVDAEISVHPVTKKPVVYLSDWDGGMIILDFTTPQAPTVLGSWADTGADGGALHSTRSIDGVYNGHHYLLAGQEFTGHPSNRPSGWIYILDDTDPANVKEVGRWTLPVDTQAKWGSVELFSTHYFRVVNDTAFVAMYHGGVWAFKLDFDHPENMKEPVSEGVFVPDKWVAKGRTPTQGYDYAPFVLDVFPEGGNHLVVFDALSGVYSLLWHPEMKLPAPTPWPASGKSPS
ncbi:MAG: hypothetical protein QOE90_1841 [Thermoplasmata archaeon]|jgi:hypothetical protein|nr:hypothetical protein [Thermoplasmata archaeon]